MELLSGTEKLLEYVRSFRKKIELTIMRKYFLNLKTMAQFNPKEFVYHYRSGKPAYYSYDGELYCGTFPEKWAENFLEGTGPKECGNCAHYGSWNGVFMGYCANCAQYYYNGERGRGFIDIGRECDYNDDMCRVSAFDTYLKGVSPHDVGDKDFMDSAQVVYGSNKNDDFEQFTDFINPNNENNLSFEERYPEIDIDEVNAYYDEQFEEDVTYTLDYVGGGCCGSDYDGGYDSY